MKISERQFLKVLEKEGLFNATRILWFSKTKNQRIFSICSKTLRRRIYLRKGSSDLNVFFQNLVYDQYKFYSIPFTPKFIVDAGANIGLSTLCFSTAFPEATILAIEPDVNNFNLLQKNIMGNENIIAIRKALWFEITHLNIFDDGSGFWGLQVKEESENTMNIVNTITIPEIFESFHVEEVDILKMDIEGAEKEIFEKGNTEWLEKVKVLIIELHDDIAPGTSHFFFRKLTKYKFNLYVHGENLVFTRFDLGRAK